MTMNLTNNAVQESAESVYLGSYIQISNHYTPSCTVLCPYNDRRVDLLNLMCTFN